MVCDKCKKNMIEINKDSVHGWSCPYCGWNILTSHIDKIYDDITEYSIHINALTEVDTQKIKLIAQTAGVNYGIAKQMLTEGNCCILRAKAIVIRETIEKLTKENIPYEVTPEFKYL